MVAAIGVGLAKRALDVTLEYTRERKQFGQEFVTAGCKRDLVQMWKSGASDMALMKAAFKVRKKRPTGECMPPCKNTAAERLCSAPTKPASPRRIWFHVGIWKSRSGKSAHHRHLRRCAEVQNMIIGRELILSALYLHVWAISTRRMLSPIAFWKRWISGQ